MAYGLSGITQNGVDYRINDPNIANEFSASTAYSAGTYVNYNGILYRFTVDHPAGAWNASHVSAVEVGNEIADLKSAVNTSINSLSSKKVNQPLDEYKQPANGKSGQSLRTKGDGTTEWADVGLPTDEQTAYAVSDWLNNHPEATTTVQDGSLTLQKFKNGEIPFVTPEMFGARGDGETDDSDALILACEHENVLLSNKTYKVTKIIPTQTSKLIGNGNSTILFDGETQVILAPKNTNFYMEGIRLNGNDKAIKGIAVTNDIVGQLYQICNCEFYNFNNNNLPAAVAGIYSTGEIECFVIRNCIIKNVSRNFVEGNISASVGLALINITNLAIIDGNYIENITPDSTRLLDADGIECYQINATGEQLNTAQIIICNNTIKNCYGRFIKIQGQNNVIINNYCYNNTSLMGNFRGIDCQTGSGIIKNNKLVILGNYTGLGFIQISTRPYSSGFSPTIISDNIIYSDNRKGSGIILQLSNKNANFVITNNYFNCNVGISTSLLETLSLYVSIIINSNILTTITPTAIHTNNFITTVIDDNVGLESKTKTLDLLNSKVNTSVSYDGTYIADFLDNVFNDSEIGYYFINAIWKTHDNYICCVNKKSATSGVLTLFTGSRIYQYYVITLDDKRLYEFTGTAK